jgi:hypothetical protein
MNATWIKPFFIVASLYDGILGVAFLFFWATIYQHFGVTPPNHGAYVQFPALLLLIFAAMFLRIARDPVRNRDLILYGVALKVSYSGLAFWYYFTSEVPVMWMPFAWADLVFLALFVVAWKGLGGISRA